MPPTSWYMATHLFSTPHAVTSHWQLKINHGGHSYITEICKCCTFGLPPQIQLVSIYWPPPSPAFVIEENHLPLTALQGSVFFSCDFILLLGSGNREHVSFYSIWAEVWQQILSGEEPHCLFSSGS